MSLINPKKTNMFQEHTDFESYLDGLKNQDNNLVLTTAALSSEIIQETLLRAQNGFINCGLIDADGNPNFSMTYTEKIELFEETNNNTNWISKFLDAYQKDLISVENVESAVSQSTDAITNTLATLHGHISSIPDLSAYMGSGDQFTIGVLSCTTAVMAGIAIAQLPEARKQMLESYEGAKTTFRKLLDGGTKNLTPTEVAGLQLNIIENLHKFANTPRECEPMDALVSGMKCAIIASYYQYSLSKDQLSEKASSLYEDVTNFFNRTLGTSKELDTLEDRQISDELSELHKLYEKSQAAHSEEPELVESSEANINSLDRNIDNNMQAKSNDNTQLESIVLDIDSQDYLDVLKSRENSHANSQECQNESLQEEQREDGLGL